jgi:hypothetical protein
MNQYLMRKQGLSRRIWVAILSLALIITMMPTFAYQAYADTDTEAIVDAIAAYRYGGSGAAEEGTLYTYVNDNTVRVVGSLTGATSTLNLDIPSGKKVIWEATLSGDVGADPDVSLVNISGGGIFEVADGALTNSKDINGEEISYDTIRVSANSTVNITGGTVSASGEESVAIRATDNSTVNIAGGAVSNTGGFGIAICAVLNSKVNITGGTISTTGNGSYAIFTKVSKTEIDGEVNIMGGTVSASGDESYAIYHNPQEDDVEYNFTITIFANAIIIGKTIDDLTYDKNIKVSTPTATPYSATFTTERTVTLSATTPGASIYYTTDGTVPTTGSTLYSGPFTLTATTTVKAIAAKTHFTNSEVLSATFTKAPTGTVATPVATPNGGTFATEQIVTLSSDTLGASIYYTTDGTEPATGSMLYSAPFKLTATTMVKAIAVKENFVNSEILSVTFTKEPAVPKEIQTLKGPLFSKAQAKIAKNADNATKKALKKITNKAKQKVKVGKKVTIKAKSIKGFKVSYQWYAGNKAIAKATKKTYKIAKQYKGKNLILKISYTTTEKSSVTDSTKYKSAVYAPTKTYTYKFGKINK